MELVWVVLVQIEDFEIYLEEEVSNASLMSYKILILFVVSLTSNDLGPS